MHQICYCLLRMDDNGDAQFDDELLNSTTQVYADAIGIEKDTASKRGTAAKFGVNDLLKQPSPRLFSSHIRYKNLPPSLSKAGKVVMISRNPKDALVSAFFFYKKLWDDAANNGMDPKGFEERVGKGMAHHYKLYNEIVTESEFGYCDWYTWHEE